MPTRNYKYLLFDLDHTLWDFEKNSAETLMQLFFEFELDLKLKTGCNQFISSYSKNNAKLWKEYELGDLTKDVLRWKRFEVTFNEFGYSNKELATQICFKYIELCPLKTHLLPGTIETLEQLKLEYTMLIVTNGFSEVQKIKLDKSGLESYFVDMVNPDTADARKPQGRIFKQALDKLGAKRNECLMIGDSHHSDVMGAKKFGIDQVFFNPSRNSFEPKPTFEIQNIPELLAILNH